MSTEEKLKRLRKIQSDSYIYPKDWEWMQGELDIAWAREKIAIEAYENVLKANQDLLETIAELRGPGTGPIYSPLSEQGWLSPKKSKELKADRDQILKEAIKLVEALELVKNNIGFGGRENMLAAIHTTQEALKDWQEFLKNRGESR